MKSQLVIFSIFILYSCGVRRNEDSAIVPSLGEYTGVQSRLSSTQKSSAVRVCQSFRTKRFNFSSMGGNQFDFSFYHFYCDESDGFNYNLSAKLIYESNFLPMYFNYEKDLEYFRDIETDTHGILAEFCKDVLAGNDVFNELNDKGNSKVIFDFVKAVDKRNFTLGGKNLSLGVDKVSISFASTEDDKTLINKVVLLELITEENNEASNFIGLVTRKEEKESCVSKKNAIQIESVKIQTFIQN